MYWDHVQTYGCIGLEISENYRKGRFGGVPKSRLNILGCILGVFFKNKSRGAYSGPAWVHAEIP